MRIVEVKLMHVGGYVAEQYRELDLDFVGAMWPYDGDDEGDKTIVKLKCGEDWVIKGSHGEWSGRWRGGDPRLDSTPVDKGVPLNEEAPVKRGPGRPKGSKNKEVSDKVSHPVSS